MRLTLLLLLIFAFVGISSAQNGKSVTQITQKIETLKNSKEFSVFHDDSSNQNSIAFNIRSEMRSAGDYYSSSMPSANNGSGFSKISRLGIKLGFVFDGDTLTKNADNFFLSISYSGSNYLLPNKPRLTALVDGTSINLGEGRGSQKGVFQTGTTTEYFSFIVSRENLQKMAAAKSLELRAGNFVRKINSEHIKSFGEILNLSDAGI